MRTSRYLAYAAIAALLLTPGAVHAGEPGTAAVNVLSHGSLGGTVVCVYRAAGGAVTGVTSNADNSMAFSNEQFTRFSGPGLCFANAFWTATYAPVRDSSQPGSPIVFVN